MTTSLSELRLNAEQGNVAAQFNLGTAYLGQTDFVEAAKWYLKAAEQGHMYAQHEIGLLYFHGRGVSQDYAAAERWYREAEKQGLSQAKLARENLEHLLKSSSKDKENQHASDEQKLMTLEEYKRVAAIAGSATAVVVFIGSWIYCISTYGFLFGVGLGWLPSGIVAVISGFVVGWLWPLAALGIIILLLLMLQKV